MENSMGKVLTIRAREKLKKVNGKKERDYDGLQIMMMMKLTNE